MEEQISGVVYNWNRATTGALGSLETYKARVYSHHTSDTYNTAYASLIQLSKRYVP